MEAMGGDKRFVERLDSLFTMHLPDEFFAQTEDVTREGLLGTYVHGNEPSHHIPYLYSWTTEPWKTQYWIREIMNRMYRNNIDGLCGNDDCGQMSAWYIFSAMGFYPVNPSDGKYQLGTPLFKKVTIKLGQDRKFVIQANRENDRYIYVKEVLLNGDKLDRTWITHDEIMNGGKLEFVLTPEIPQK